jgi:hypothetical protein
VLEPRQVAESVSLLLLLPLGYCRRLLHLTLHLGGFGRGVATSVSTRVPDVVEPDWVDISEDRIVR